MPAGDPVVANTSPLLNLDLVDRLDLLEARFETIHAPEQVWSELDAGLVLLDERDGRRVARRHDLGVTGVVGILFRGAREGAVELRAELDALRDAGFWISDGLYAEALIVITASRYRRDDPCR